MFSTPQTSGVYMIRSKKHPDQFYIGSTNNLYRRRADHLYKDRTPVKKYRDEGLEFIVLKLCNPCHLMFWEQYYISELKPPLNTFKFASAPDDNKSAGYAAMKDIYNDGRSNTKVATFGYPWQEKNVRLWLDIDESRYL